MNERNTKETFMTHDDTPEHEKNNVFSHMVTKEFIRLEVFKFVGLGGIVGGGLAKLPDGIAFEYNNSPLMIIICIFLFFWLNYIYLIRHLDLACGLNPFKKNRH